MIKTSCFFCGKEIVNLPSPKRNRTYFRKFCSISCKGKYTFREHHDYYKSYWLSRPNLWRWKKERLCNNCGQKYLPKTVQQKYCLNPCNPKRVWKKKHWRQYLDINNQLARKKARENWKDKRCAFCSKVFLPDIRHKYAVYCSVNCRVKANWRKAVETGKYKINATKYRERHREEIRERDNNYKAKIRFGAVSKTLNKRIVIERDKGLCQLCGRLYQVIHHIRYSGKPEDLVCLCRVCHASLHQRVLTPPFLLLPS